MVKLIIVDKDKEIVNSEVKPKKFKTGKVGYYINGVTVIDGKAHRYSLLLIEMK